MKKFLILMMLSFLFSGCTSLKLKLLGYQPPKVETYNSVQEYAQKRIGEGYDIWVFSKKEDMSEALNKNFFIPDARFYNQDGIFVDYRSSPEDCNAHIESFIKEFDQLSSTADTGFSITDFNQKLINTQTKESFNQESIKKNSDGYLFIFWTKYIGKLNKKKTWKWVEVAENIKQKGKNFEVILVNVDFLEEWGLTQDQIDEMLKLEVD